MREVVGLESAYIMGPSMVMVVEAVTPQVLVGEGELAEQEAPSLSPSSVPKVAAASVAEPEPVVVTFDRWQLTQS